MKGGGLTWAGWLMIGVGGLLLYAGMTGQSLIGELQSVLSGQAPHQPVPDSKEQKLDSQPMGGAGGRQNFPTTTSPAGPAGGGTRPRPVAVAPHPTPRVAP